MRIKITPLTENHNHLEGIFKFKRNYYLAKFHSAGIITEIKKSDSWLEQEMSWVSRSEIPWVTVLRHFQLESEHLVEGSLTPILKKHDTHYFIENVEKFPSKQECMNLIYKYCGYSTNGDYHFYTKKVNEGEIVDLMHGFDYKNNIMIRAGSCLYKAYTLLNTSSAFAEEVYINVFVAFEAIVELLKSRHGFKGKGSRNKVVDLIENYLKIDNPGIDFRDYEEEMREGIRNNIIHPYRTHSGDKIAQPFLAADYIFEDLGFIDWIFKKVIEGKIQ
jgi:hypothetical protein